MGKIVPLVLGFTTAVAKLFESIPVCRNDDAMTTLFRTLADSPTASSSTDLFLHALKPLTKPALCAAGKPSSHVRSAPEIFVSSPHSSATATPVPSTSLKAPEATAAAKIYAAIAARSTYRMPRPAISGTDEIESNDAAAGVIADIQDDACKQFVRKSLLLFGGGVKYFLKLTLLDGSAFFATKPPSEASWKTSIVVGSLLSSKVFRNLRFCCMAWPASVHRAFKTHWQVY